MVCLVFQRAWWLLALLWANPGRAQSPALLAGSQPLDLHGDFSREMVAGIDRFALRELDRAMERRAALWNRDYSSPTAYERSTNVHRDRFRRMIGVVDERVPMPGMELVSTLAAPAQLGESTHYTILVVRWLVFENVYGEGVLIQPKGTVRARIVAVPDADQTPEMVA